MNKLQILHSIYLFYVLGVLSWAAIRSRSKLAAVLAVEDRAKKAASRERVLFSTLISLALLFGMSWMVANLSGIRLFTMPRLGAGALIASVVAFFGHFGFRQIAIWMHTPEQLKNSRLRAWMPQTAREWALYLPVAIGAGVAEEASYRGVAWTLLTWMTGNAVAAGLLCAVAFGLAHSTQGWKSALVIFGIAVMMHALVWYTHTLVLAMIVHAVYDIAVGVLISRRLVKQERELEAASVAL